VSALPSTHHSTDPLQILQEVFGYADFRGPQADIVDHVVDGGDALVLMPTGGASRCATRFRPLHGGVPATA
jgi:ATP-dependent DNA helicase RecQ